MKTITAIHHKVLAVALAFFCASSAVADDGNVRVTQARKVENFHAINIVTVGNIYFTQGDTYSLRLEGKEKYVNNTTTTVSDGGTLTIGYKSKKPMRGNNNGIDIYLTAPTLDDLRFTGVGSFCCEKGLKLEGDLSIHLSGVGQVDIDDLRCRDLDLHVSGVGDAKVKVNCEHVDATMSGVGNITLRGRAKTANLHRSGIGDLDSDGLEVEE